MTILDTWESYFGGNVDQIFKGQFGSVLIRDYDPTRPLTNWTPFDTETGEFRDDFYDSTTNTFAEGWLDLGYGSESGVVFTPTMAVADTKAWQSRQKLRTDVTEEDEMAEFVSIQSNPIIDAINMNLPLASVGAIGSVGYQATKPKITTLIPRQIAFIGIDMSKGLFYSQVRVYPFALMAKPGKFSWDSKTESQTPLTFEPRPDQASGFAVRKLCEGPGWRALGGTTATPGTPVATAAGAGVATLSFVAPASPNGPFLYNVFVDASPTPVTGSAVTVGGTSAHPILTVGTQTAGAHTYKVQAVGSNLSGSAKTPASNSITVT